MTFKELEKFGLIPFSIKQLKNKRLHPIDSTFSIIIGRTEHGEEKRKEYRVINEDTIELVRNYLYS